MSDGTDNQRQQVLELLRRYGQNTCSFQALERGLSYWFDGDEACVAYADTGGAWIAAGEPLCADDRREEVASHFCEAAREHGRRPRFFALERDLGDEISRLHIGMQPMWNPQDWPETLRGKRSLREQLRRARAKGVRVREAGDDELEPGHDTRRGIDRLIDRWLESKSLAPMGFLVELDVYQAPEERRFLLAEKDGELVGILIAVPVFARNGWFFEDVLRDPSAPNGTVELLFHTAMEHCREAGSDHATFGLAPLAEVPSKTLTSIRDRTRWLYDFEGLRRFKDKLRPERWEPVYLGYPAGEHGIGAVIDSLRAFARGSFVGFAVATLRHRARLVVAVLTLLLIPWTAVLAILPVRFFPSAMLKSAWVGYDLVLLVGLLALLMRWRTGLAALLALGALVDFALGCAQLVLYNSSRIEGLLDGGITVLALVAPAFAAIFLWSNRHRYDSPEPDRASHRGLPPEARRTRPPDH